MRARRLPFLFALAAAIVLPVRLWVVEPIYIPTPSMEPTLPVGTHLFMDKVTLALRVPRRGEIIVFRAPDGEELDVVKRVIAVGGDSVELRAKKVFLNGAEQDEPYVQHTRPEEKLEGDTLGPLTVPEGTLFVLGDNRDESKDSSVWKDKTGQPIYFLPLENVRGLVRGAY